MTSNASVAVEFCFLASFSGKIAPRSKSADFAAREPPEAPSDILPPPVAKIEEVAAAAVCHSWRETNLKIYLSRDFSKI